MQPGSSWTTSELNTAEETPGDERSLRLIQGLTQSTVAYHSDTAQVHGAFAVSLSYQSITRSHVMCGAEGCV